MKFWNIHCSSGQSSGGDTGSVLIFQLNIKSNFGSVALKLHVFLPWACNKTNYVVALILISWTFFVDCINPAGICTDLLQDETVEIYKDLNTSLFTTGILILKPYKEKGRQFVHKNTVVSVLFKIFNKMGFVNRGSVGAVGNNVRSWEDPLLPAKTKKH